MTKASVTAIGACRSRREGVGRDVGREHEAIMRAALARDAEGCRALMRDHFQRTTDILIRSPVIMGPDDEEHPQ